MLADQRSQAGGPDQHADQDEADHRTDLEPCESGDHDARSTENHQRVAEPLVVETNCHGGIKAGRREFVRS